MMLWGFLLGSNVFAANVQEPAVDENIKPLRIGFFTGTALSIFK